MIRIYDFFKNKNIKVYFPAQHKGLCEFKYVVVRKSSQIASLGTNVTGQQIVDIILYSPRSSYLQAMNFAKEVKQVLKEIDFLRKTGFETPWIVDDEKEAITMSIEYVIQKDLGGDL